MKLKEGEKHSDPTVKSDSINETIHKVRVLTPSRFTIDDTRKFEAHVKGGVIKQLKTKVILKSSSYE